MISSPLRYPGGKAKLYPFFAELININHLFGSLYCEPYAGGAGLAFRLLSAGFVERICINDIDKSIYAFWKSALFSTEDFCRLINETPITIEEWYRQRDVWRDCDPSKPLQLGFSAYFLNRTNRSGIIEGAGPIGGYEQKGEWKIDVRFIKKTQIANIRSLALYARQVEVQNVDAMEFIDKNIGRQNCITYLDPPYFVKGHKLYKNFYEPHDHAMIADILSRNRSLRWVVSYDDVPEIRAAYQIFSPISYSLNYSAGKKSIGSEVMFLSDSLLAPSIGGFNLAA